MPNVYQFKDFEGSSHRILLDLVRRFARRRGMLLDLGAAGGELGEALRGQFDRSIGIEHDLDRIGQLKRRFDSVVIGDLERIEQLPGPADAIVLADVLEHLRTAGRILQVVRESIHSEGTLFVSVPNIANITIRIGLLLGIFTYRERGILDETHLRFYTLKTIRAQLEAAGFEIIAVSGSSVPLRLILGSRTPEIILRIGERILTLLTRMWEALFAYQIILVARPAPPA